MEEIHKMGRSEVLHKAEKKLHDMEDDLNKLNDYRRKYYLAKKNKTKEKLEDIKKDIEKLKEKIHLLDGHGLERMN